MPSPIAHAVAGYSAYRVFSNRFPEIKRIRRYSANFNITLLIFILLSLVPDLDAIPGLAFGDLARFHNNLTHSLLVGLLIAVPVAAVLARWFGLGIDKWALVVFASYAIHLVMDFLTDGRGIMALWPFTSTRFESPISFFYGFHYSDGLVSIRHLWTLLTELAFAVVTILSVNAIIKRMSTGQPQPE